VELDRRRSGRHVQLLKQPHVCAEGTPVLRAAARLDRPSVCPPDQPARAGADRSRSELFDTAKAFPQRVPLRAQRAPRRRSHELVPTGAQWFRPRYWSATFARGWKASDQLDLITSGRNDDEPILTPSPFSVRVGCGADSRRATRAQVRCVSRAALSPQLGRGRWPKGATPTGWSRHGFVGLISRAREVVSAVRL
jgi:hypothetical protein